MCVLLVLALSAFAFPNAAWSVENSPSQQQPGDSAGALSEIIVTAEKFKEPLQETPVPMTVIRSDSLIENNQTQLQDYYASVPGLSIAPSGAYGLQMVDIRGLTTGIYTSPTVAVTLDDVPLTSFLSGTVGVPEIDPNDLDHIEVLRGPQGTLYGANSLGGLIKYATADPSLHGYSGRVDFGADTVHNGNEPGFDVRGALNAPVGDNVGIRVSAFSRQDAGYIDDPMRTLRGVNVANTEGGRVVALWKPSEAFYLKISAMLEDSRKGGTDTSLPSLGDLQQNDIPLPFAYRKRFQLYSAVMGAAFGVFDVTSITGYLAQNLDFNFDESGNYRAQASRLYGVTGAVAAPVAETDNRLTQEIRFSHSIGSAFDWKVGGFYLKEHYPWHQFIMAANFYSGSLAGSLINYYGNYSAEEYSGFADLTVHLAHRFDIQVGGREEQDKENIQSSDAGLLAPGGSQRNPSLNSAVNAATYLLTPRMKISPHLMIYGRLASGFRPGVGNFVPQNSGIPSHSDPDKTRDYDIGIKGSALNGALSFDAALYYVDWKDIQLSLVYAGPPAAGYTGNGSEARSKGVELSVKSRPLAGLTVATSMSFEDAELSEPIPPGSSINAAPGDRLPYSSRFSGYFSVDQEIPLPAGISGFIGGSLSYVGNREGEFLTKSSAVPRQYLPAYAKLDMHVGATTDDLWTMSLYLNNVTDKRGVLSDQGWTGAPPPFGFVYIQPRTIGLSVSKLF